MVLLKVFMKSSFGINWYPYKSSPGGLVVIEKALDVIEEVLGGAVNRFSYIRCCRSPGGLLVTEEVL